jgi:hypothetical protein
MNIGALLVQNSVAVQANELKGIDIAGCESNVEEPLEFHSDSIQLKPKVCHMTSPSKPEVCFR